MSTGGKSTAAVCFNCRWLLDLRIRRGQALTLQFENMALAESLQVQKDAAELANLARRVPRDACERGRNIHTTGESQV